MLLGNRALLEGRTLRVALTCQQAGKITVTRSGRRLGAAAFACANNAATATVSLKQRDARRLKMDSRARIRVTARVGATTTTRTLRVARAVTHARRSSAWATLGGSCGSRYSAPPGYFVSGIPVSKTGYADWTAIKYWAFSDYGWQPLMDWWGWFYMPPGEGPSIGSFRVFWPNPGVWFAIGVQSWDWYAGGPDFHWIYPGSTSLGLAEQISGAYCKTFY